MKKIKKFEYDIDPLHDEDPISGVAQLFDVSIAFIVAVIAALFAMMSSSEILSKDSEWTLTRKTRDGNIEIVEKKENEIVTKKVSGKNMSGNGRRLGTAYELENGEIIYVPDDGANPKD
ncbi:MAG: DUF2149 domain-containing protein [Anditalea sp.]